MSSATMKYIKKQIIMKTLTKKDIEEFITEQGLNLFGNHAPIIAKILADEVLEEYNECGDGNLPKAVAYVVWDKFTNMEYPTK